MKVCYTGSDQRAVTLIPPCSWSLGYEQTQGSGAEVGGLEWLLYRNMSTSIKRIHQVRDPVGVYACTHMHMHLCVHVSASEAGKVITLVSSVPKEPNTVSLVDLNSVITGISPRKTDHSPNPPSGILEQSPPGKLSGSPCRVADCLVCSKSDAEEQDGPSVPKEQLCFSARYSPWPAEGLAGAAGQKGLPLQSSRPKSPQIFAECLPGTRGRAFLLASPKNGSRAS